MRIDSNKSFSERTADMPPRLEDSPATRSWGAVVFFRLLGWACLLPSLPAHAEITLVRDGQPQSVICLDAACRAPAHRAFADALGELDAWLRSSQSAQGDDPGVNARIRVATDAVHYARLVTSLLEVARDKQSPVVTERLAAVEAFLQTKALPPELAPLHSPRDLRRALSYAEREVE